MIEFDLIKQREFRYDEKNAVKLEEERRIQAEIDEEKSRKIFFFDFKSFNVDFI